MTKQKIPWLMLSIVAAVAWYGWQSGWFTVPQSITNQTGPANETSGLSGGLAVGQSRFLSEITGIIREADEEQVVAVTEAGETALVTSVSQQVSDLSQTYDENQF